jgi:dihydroxyacetone kinase-like protein|tara:strand:- start:793 stop:1440 length:648 start_codon:yes stop_codon:yes gene_type:complete
LSAELIKRLIVDCSENIEINREILTELDAQIGDADHGNNLNRGFQAIKENSAEIVQLNLSDAFKKSGMTLVMKVGGASGPLYGSLLMGMGKQAGEEPITPQKLSKMLWNGIEDVQKRGKAEAGEKTMLDVLIPAVKQLDKDIENGSLFKETIENVIKASEEGLESTKAMKALKGRASYLGERSIGHLDPGAMSSSLLIKAVCRVLNEKSNSKIDD